MRGAVRERRARLRETLRARDGVDPDDVIFPPPRAEAAGLTGTLAFLTGQSGAGGIGREGDVD